MLPKHLNHLNSVEGIEIVNGSGATKRGGKVDRIVFTPAHEYCVFETVQAIKATNDQSYDASFLRWFIWD